MSDSGFGFQTTVTVAACAEAAEHIKITAARNIRARSVSFLWTRDFMARCRGKSSAANLSPGRAATKACQLSGLHEIERRPAARASLRKGWRFCDGDYKPANALYLTAACCTRRARASVTRAGRTRKS